MAAAAAMQHCSGQRGHNEVGALLPEQEIWECMYVLKIYLQGNVSSYTYVFTT